VEFSENMDDNMDLQISLDKLPIKRLDSIEENGMERFPPYAFLLFLTHFKRKNYLLMMMAFQKYLQEQEHGTLIFVCISSL